MRLHKESEWIGSDGNMPELAIVPKAIWKLAQSRLVANSGKPKNDRLRSGGKAVYMLSGLLCCAKCDAHYVMESGMHCRIAGYLDGKKFENGLRVRRDVAEAVILRPIHD